MSSAVAHRVGERPAERPGGGLLPRAGRDNHGERRVTGQPVQAVDEVDPAPGQRRHQPRRETTPTIFAASIPMLGS
jgi:hypothetical protein